jgi:beta-galactosidase
VDGAIVQSGHLPVLGTPPGLSEIIQLPYSRPLMAPGVEAFLNLHFQLAADTPWAEAGHEVAWEQIKLLFAAAQPTILPLQTMSALYLENTDDRISIQNQDFKVAFDRANGQMTHYDWKGARLVQSGPRLNAWRAPSDNDGFKWNPTKHGKLLQQWLQAGLDRLAYRLEALEIQQPEPQRIRIKTTLTEQAEVVPAGYNYSLTYDIYGNGAVLVDMHLDCFGDLPPLPRLGLSLIVPTGFEIFTWLGRGPHESYVDCSKAGVAVGLYRGTVDEQYVPYIMPQENSNKTDVRWAALSNAQGLGLLAIGKPLMEDSIDTIYRAMHTNELRRGPEIHFNLDLMQCGLGGASCGPATLDKYLVWPGERRYSIPLRPFENGEALQQLGANGLSGASKLGFRDQSLSRSCWMAIIAT